MRTIYSPEPIATQGQIRGDGWNEIQRRSAAGKKTVQLKCPACQIQITPRPDGGYGCRSCQHIATVFLIREDTDDDDVKRLNTTILRMVEAHCNDSEIHVFYLRVGRDKQLLCRLPLVCLSCEGPSRKIRVEIHKISGDSYIETYYCSQNCGVRTYYQLRYEEENGFSLVPYIDTYMWRHEDDPLEIPEASATEPITDAPPSPQEIPSHQPHTIETLDTQTTPETQPDAPQSQHPTQTPQNDTDKRSKHASHHKDVIGQILAYFTEKDVSVAKREDLLKFIEGSAVRLNTALKQLIKIGEIRRISKGYYEKIK